MKKAISFLTLFFFLHCTEAKLDGNIQLLHFYRLLSVSGSAGSGAATGIGTGTSTGTGATTTGSTSSAAIALTIGDPYKQGTLSSSSSTLWYSLSVTSGSSYTVQYDATTASGYTGSSITTVAYYSDLSTTYLSSASSTSGFRSFTATSTGMVYIRTDTNNTTGGTFGIRVVPQATTLTNGNAYITKTASSTNSYTEWFSFNTIIGNSYSVYWDDSGQGTATKTVDVQVSIYHNDFTQTPYLTLADSGYTTINSFTATATETVFIKAVGKNNSSGSFGIRYQFKANPLTLNASYVQGNLTTQQTVQWYTISATSGTSYTVQYDATTASGYTGSSITTVAYYSDLSTTYLSSASSISGTRSFTATSTGMVYILTYTNNTTGTFGIKVTSP